MKIAGYLTLDGYFIGQKPQFYVGICSICWKVFYGKIAKSSK